MKILKLSAENIKRLSVVEITPDGSPVIVIGGKNGAGKSSVLDAIEMALGGAAHTPGKPVRIGQDRGKVVVDLGDIVVTRTFTASGGGSLVVGNKEGARFTSPQAMLDKLIGRLSFDPLDFERMDAKKQREALSALVGLDTADLDHQHADLYAERTLVNKTIKNLEGHLAGLIEHPDVPAEEVSIGALADELAAAEQTVRALDRARTTYESLTKDHAFAVSALKQDEAELEELRRKVTAMEFTVSKSREAVVVKAHAVEAAKQAGLTTKAALIDSAPIRARMAEAESINAKVRANAERQKLQAAHEAERKVAQEMTAKLAEIEKAKAARVGAVTFPVPGLGIDANGVTLDGVPFDQASQAQRLRASVAIGLALNPKLRVLLVREGSALDSNSMKLLAEIASAAGAQVWLERVAETRDGVSVLIEDGAVKAESAELTEVAG